MVVGNAGEDWEGHLLKESLLADSLIGDMSKECSRSVEVAPWRASVHQLGSPKYIGIPHKDSSTQATTGPNPGLSAPGPYGSYTTY